MGVTIRLLIFFTGLILFSYGIATAIQVQYLGIHPWDVLSIALNDTFGLTIGTWNLFVGIILIVVSLIIDPQYIRTGTLLNAVSVGPLIDVFLILDTFPSLPSTAGDVVILVLAIVIMGIGGGMYSAAGIGAGPRDGFMLSISDKTGLSIQRTRITVESGVLVLGWLLGGPVFVFTFLYTFIQSPIFQFSFLNTSKGLNRIFKPENKRTNKN